MYYAIFYSHVTIFFIEYFSGIFATSSEIKSFSEEILILQNFHHPHVMSLIGVCLGADKLIGGPSIVLPFMSKGSLLDFLRKEATNLRPSVNADVTQVSTCLCACFWGVKSLEFLGRTLELEMEA